MTGQETHLQEGWQRDQWPRQVHIARDVLKGVPKVEHPPAREFVPHARVNPSQHRLAGRGKRKEWGQLLRRTWACQGKAAEPHLMLHGCMSTCDSSTLPCEQPEKIGSMVMSACRIARSRWRG